MSVAGTRGCEAGLRRSTGSSGEGFGAVGVGKGKYKEVKLRSKMVGYLSLRAFRIGGTTRPNKKKKNKKRRQWHIDLHFY